MTVRKTVLAIVLLHIALFVVAGVGILFMREAGLWGEPAFSAVQSEAEAKNEIVWIPETGEKYHNRPTCCQMQNPKRMLREEAERRGYEPCKNCYGG